VVLNFHPTEIANILRDFVILSLFFSIAEKKRFGLTASLAVGF